MDQDESCQALGNALLDAAGVYGDKHPESTFGPNDIAISFVAAAFSLAEFVASKTPDVNALQARQIAAIEIHKAASNLLENKLGAAPTPSLADEIHRLGKLN